MRKPRPLLGLCALAAPFALLFGVAALLNHHTYIAAGLLAFAAITALEVAAHTKPTGDNNGKTEH